MRKPCQDLARQKYLPLLQGMVLPDRIELSTSPLPMECSTTELRQHARIKRIGQKGLTRRADPCHKAPVHASAGTACKLAKNAKFRIQRPGCPNSLDCRAV